MKTIYFFTLIIVLFIVQSCGFAGNKENVKQISDVSTVEASVTDYGNGVFYFDDIRSDFANTLSGFIKTHPDLELVSMAANGSGLQGTDEGYFVVFKKINKQ